MDCKQQVAVITGAANGIGLALTECFLKEGIHVVMADNAVSPLCDQVERLSEQSTSEVLGVVCDVTKPSSVQNLAKQAFEHFDRVDYLINNAGISGHMATLWELTPEHIHKVMDVNLYGVIHTIQAFLPHFFKQEESSHIVNMASLYGLCSGSLLSAYAMSKHAIVALTESLYFDFKRTNKNIDLSVVCPSFVNTGLVSNSTPIHQDKLHQLMGDLVSRSRPADDVATHILAEIQKKIFYIMPDKEVKNYCTSRNEAIVFQQEPHVHSIEKIIVSLCTRAKEEL
ncbi:MAG: SDR family NAD(P)-dependent oxidoreductase [Proteobacteria bacterium]|nr:SDR family NAD(P)-dependent oxidoreductase [Pseudomonadota bacterium]